MARVGRAHQTARARRRHRLIGTVIVVLLVLGLASGRFGGPQAQLGGEAAGTGSSASDTRSLASDPKVVAADATLTVAAVTQDGGNEQQQAAAQAQEQPAQQQEQAADKPQEAAKPQEPAAAAAEQLQQQKQELTRDGKAPEGVPIEPVPADKEHLRTGIFYTTGGEENTPVVAHEVLNEPIPEDCYLEEHADYDGPALRWGLTHKLPSAAQCCQACKDLSKPQADGQRCNIWVWCGDPSGECWSPDIWNHTTGECWLKYQVQWDGKVDRAATNLVVNRRGAYPEDFRNIHKTAPALVAWSAGVIPPK